MNIFFILFVSFNILFFLHQKLNVNEKCFIFIIFIYRNTHSSIRSNNRLFHKTVNRSYEHLEDGKGCGNRISPISPDWLQIHQFPKMGLANDHIDTFVNGTVFFSFLTLLYVIH